MTGEEKRDLEETVEILKVLDKASLSIVKIGAEILKTRQDMELDSQDKKAG